MNIKKGTITVVDSTNKLTNYQIDGKVIVYTGETTGNVKSNTMYRYSSTGSAGGTPYYKVTMENDATNIWYVQNFNIGTQFCKYEGGTMVPYQEYPIASVEEMDLGDTKMMYVELANIGFWVSDEYPADKTLPEPAYVIGAGAGWIEI